MRVPTEAHLMSCLTGHRTKGMRLTGLVCEGVWLHVRGTQAAAHDARG